MSINSSFNFSLDSVIFSCYNDTVTTLIGTASFVTKAFLLLPLSILVLYLGHQRWRQQRSFTTSSHNDIFTYHVAVMELIWCLGLAITYCGSYTNLQDMVKVGNWFQYLALSGEAFFHTLTYVERYLAVVHPITYLGLRNVRGVRIRNISIGCVWLLCLATATLITVDNDTLGSTSFFFLSAFYLVVVTFCTLCVLCVLIRPGPGEGGRDRERVDQSKQRALHTIMAITGALWLWFGGLIVSTSLDASQLLSRSVTCVLLSCASWFNLPCSLVLPLLYLHRAKKNIM